MKNVIIVSKCMKVVNLRGGELALHFHFKGVLAGEVIKKVVLTGREELKIKKGEEYLLYVQLMNLNQSILTGKILKVKALEDCWDKS